MRCRTVRAANFFGKNSGVVEGLGQPAHCVIPPSYGSRSAYWLRAVPHGILHIREPGLAAGLTPLSYSGRWGLSIAIAGSRTARGHAGGGWSGAAALVGHGVPGGCTPAVLRILGWPGDRRWLVGRLSAAMPCHPVWRAPPYSGARPHKKATRPSRGAPQWGAAITRGERPHATWLGRES